MNTFVFAVNMIGLAFLGLGATVAALRLYEVFIGAPRALRAQMQFKALATMHGRRIK